MHLCERRIRGCGRDGGRKNNKEKDEISES